MSNILEKRNLEKPAPIESQLAYMDEPDVAAPSMSLRDFIAVLRRRRTIALYTFATVLVIGAAMTFLTSPLFRTSARILVEGKSSQITISSGTDSMSSLFLPKSGQEVQTQVEVLRSPLFISEAFQKAGVQGVPVALDVQRVEDTDIIELTATSASRQAAEKLIAVVPGLYQERTRLDRQKEISAALDFAQNSLRSQSDKLLQTEAALEKFKNRSKVIDPTAETSTAVTSAAATRKQLVDAQAQVTTLESQLAALTSERSKSSPYADSVTTTSNPQIPLLQNQLDDLKSQRTKLLFLYKPNDDEVRKVDLQIADLKRRLEQTPKTLTTTNRLTNPVLAQLDEKIADLKVQLEAARSSLNDVRQQNQELDKSVKSINNMVRNQASLQRDLQTSTQAVAALSDTVTQLTLRKKAIEAAGSPVTVIQNGGPAVQVAPRVSRNLVVALALGLLLAAAAALLQESLDDHVRGEDEARRLVSAPVLAHFPELPTKMTTEIHDPSMPNPRMLEGFRVLRTNVQFALVGKPGRTIQVLSSIPSEGKSFTARNLATVMALDGRKVILVDADLHRPSQHRMFGVPQHPGLTHILVGRAEIEDCIQETTLPGLTIIPAGDLPPNPAELLNSSVMDEIVERLQTMADVVIFDSPPMLATADGQVLASKVDSIIYVVELGVVPRSGLQRAFELLQQVNARVIGVVFNKVDHGEFPDVYSYYGQYRPFNEAGSDGGTNGTSGGGMGTSPVVTDVKTAAKLLNGSASNDSWKPGAKTTD